MAVSVLYLMAVQWIGLGPGADLVALALALVVALATNVGIVGVNQVTDVEIDRINKPWLPLAAGTLSLASGRWLVAGAAVLALALGMVAGPWMLAAAAVGLLVGAAYSLPPLRLKRSHVLAAASITSVRALVVNLFVFAHFQQVLGDPGPIPRHVWVLTGVVVGLTMAIAWFKDLPDMEGDAAHDVSTLALVLGPPRVLAIGLAVLATCDLVVVAVALAGMAGVSVPVVVAGHLVMVAVLGTMGWRVDLADPDSVRRFYRGIWRLFVAEYVLFGIAALLA